MKKLLTILAIMFTCAGAAYAQSQYVATPVTVSKEKVKFGDRTYYSHVVLEKQTLYSICKAYGVSLEEVYEANQDLKLETEGLKKNSILRIPIHDPKAEAKAAAKDEKAAAKEEKAEVKAAEKTQDGGQTVHVVKWYEDLDGIASKYGVSKEAIMKANGLSDDKVKARTKLVIPTGGREVTETDTESKPETGEAQVEETYQPEENLAENDAEAQEEEESLEDETNEPVFKSNLRFALILPLNASGEVKSNYMDLYCGALLAARDAKEKGLDIELTVIDESRGMAALDSSSFVGMDAIIGPVLPTDMSAILGKVPSGITVISPLDAKTGALTETHPELVHTNPASNGQYGDMVNWIAGDRDEADKIIIISQKGKPAIKNELLPLFKEKGITPAVFEYDILDGRRVTETLSAMMNAKSTSRVVIASESEAFVIDATRNLQTILQRKFPIVLYGPAKYKRFETISVETLHDLDFHMSVSTNVDYNDGRVKNFLMKYRAYFSTEPKDHSFCGYDLVSYFADVLSQYGRDWRYYVGEKRSELLQTSYQFKQVGEEGGYMNVATRRMEYTPEFKLQAVR